MKSCSYIVRTRGPALKWLICVVLFIAFAVLMSRDYPLRLPLTLDEVQQVTRLLGFRMPAGIRCIRTWFMDEGGFTLHARIECNVTDLDELNLYSCAFTEGLQRERIGGMYFVHYGPHDSNGLIARWDVAPIRRTDRFVSCRFPTSRAVASVYILVRVDRKRATLYVVREGTLDEMSPELYESLKRYILPDISFSAFPVPGSGTYIREWP